MTHNGSRKQTTKPRYSRETSLIYGESDDPRWDYGHHLVPPISASATFRLDTAARGARGFTEFAHSSGDENITTRSPIYVYDRLGEPNKDMLEENLALAEQADTAVTFASGMAAVSALFGILTGSGSEVLAHKTLYGCTYSLLTTWFPRLNIKVKFVDFTDLDQIRRNLSTRTRVLYMESPVNPTLHLIDLAGVASVAKEINAQRPAESKIFTVVDSTFATPFCQRPIGLGIDFVIHSLTKAIGGFGTDIGGAVIGPMWSRDSLLLYRKDFGGVLSSKAAWTILVHGLPSLAVRMRQMQSSALRVATYLSTRPEILKVNYPGLPEFSQADLFNRQMRDYDGNPAPGGMIYFVLGGLSPVKALQSAERLINYIAKNAYCITLAVSLGNIRTLVEHPGSMTHSSVPAEEQINRGLDPGGIRLSIGLERPEDIIQDLEIALEKTKLREEALDAL